MYSTHRAPIRPWISADQPVTRRLASGHRSSARPVIFLASFAFVFSLSISLLAQEDSAEGTPLEGSVRSPTMQETPVSGTPVISSLPRVWYVTPDEPLLRWGPVGVRPHFFYRYVHGSGIQSRPGHAATVAINSFSPGVLFNLGPRWTFDYTAAKTFYSDREFRDSLNHSVLLAGTTSYRDWAFYLSQTYASTSDSLVETGGQTSQHSYVTSVRVNRDLGSRLGLELNASQNVRLVGEGPDSRDWSTAERLHVQWMPGFDTFAGIQLGYVDVFPGPNMTYARPAVGVTWNATPKISVAMQAGLESRQFNKTGVDNLTNGIWSASIQYQPFVGTGLAFRTGREVSAAYFANAVTENAQWGIYLEQRLLGHFHLSASYARQSADYVSTGAVRANLRQDDFSSYSVRLSTVILRGLTVAALYQRSRNSSDVPGFALSSHEIGVELGYQF